MHTNFNVGFSSHKNDVHLHLSQWQYWWWFWFALLWSLYFLVVIRLILTATENLKPTQNTSLRSHGKWGDFLVALIPLSWCGNILVNSNYILRMIEWQNEASLFVLRIQGKQWYWSYKYSSDTNLRLQSVYLNVGNNNWYKQSPKNNYQLYNQNSTSHFLYEYEFKKMHKTILESKNKSNAKVKLLQHATHTTPLSNDYTSNFKFKNKYTMPKILYIDFKWLNNNRIFSKNLPLQNTSVVCPSVNNYKGIQFSFLIDGILTNLSKKFTAVNYTELKVLPETYVSGVRKFDYLKLSEFKYLDKILHRFVFNKFPQKFFNYAFTLKPKHYDLSCELTVIEKYFESYKLYNNSIFFNINSNTHYYDFDKLEDVDESAENLRVQVNKSPIKLIKGLLNKHNVKLLNSMRELSKQIFLNYKTQNAGITEKISQSEQFWGFRQKRYKKLRTFFFNQNYRFSNTTYTVLENFTHHEFYNKYNLYTSVKNNKHKSELIPVTLSRRLLRTKRTLILPAHINITIIASSYDVVHSWFVPGLGLKIDCVPGRSNHSTLYIDNVGFYYGQCAEICGRYHHHMPIRVCALNYEHFLLWWQTRGLNRLYRATKLQKSKSILLTKFKN